MLLHPKVTRVVYKSDDEKKNIAGKKTWILPELNAKKGRRPLKASLSRAGKIELGSKSWPSELSVVRVLVKYRPSGGRVAAKWRPSVGRVALKYRPGVGRHACRFMLTDTRPSLGQHIGRVSVAISADSIDRHSVDRCLKYTWSDISWYM